jgi:hypothetical protein
MPGLTGEGASTDTVQNFQQAGARGFAAPGSTRCAHRTRTTSRFAGRRFRPMRVTIPRAKILKTACG